ncbi:hypothetical protein F5144DRAFT_351316 [Chaetomium tenue]|uniref:Uncharacterized protein n=1 Tax=Chaetomium tenue TaxID=1854479 RepID=A0ACB7NZN4_9PEZI|nr:hypothetical protein F5144DRAFT_351316 [Chaetomium globosum]
MAPSSRPPSLPSIPDIALDLNEKAQLLPELEEVLSSGAETSTTLDEDYDFRPSRSHSTRTQNSFHRRIVLPSRFPSISSSHAPTTLTTLPLSPRHHDVTCQVQPLQLPPTQKTLHESWTITYHHPRPHPTKLHIRALGITLSRQSDHHHRGGGSEEGSVLSVVPNTHFAQAELAATVALHEASVTANAARRGGAPKRTLSKPKIVGSAAGKVGGVGGGGVGEGWWEGAVYAADLEKRVRALDWRVQDEIYELLSDRVQSSSNAFRRRDWRVVALTEVPGGELTDAPTGFRAFGETKRGWFGFGKTKRLSVKAKRWPDMPVTEYRLILRGAETKTNDQGWGHYNRYSRPWRAADEKEIGDRRRWSSFTGKSEKYVDF